MLKRCFPPVVDADTRVLILGSLPGEASLAQGQYYAHKQNRFWRLVGDMLGEDLVQMDYPVRLQTLLAHHVGLWDVVAEARREGSLDSNIRNHAGNDLIGLIDSLPNLAVIAFNGGTAEHIGLKALREHGDRHRIVRLPSSSPAHTLSYAQKAARLAGTANMAACEGAPPLTGLITQNPAASPHSLAERA